MNNTQMSTVSSAGERTWWWHPRPVAAIEAPDMSGAAMSGAQRTWWWHPRPVV